MHLHEVRGYGVAALKHLYECQYVDVTWLCTECQRRPCELNLKETRVRIGAFDTGRLERTMDLVPRARA